jgi:hypothetical protein
MSGRPCATCIKPKPGVVWLKTWHFPAGVFGFPGQASVNVNYFLMLPDGSKKDSFFSIPLLTMPDQGCGIKPGSSYSLT